MNKKMMTIVVAAVLMVPLASYAGHESGHNHDAQKSVAAADAISGQVVHVAVNGLVCDFCAQSLKKVFLKKEATQDIDVSLEKKLVTITLKPGKDIPDADIKKMVVDAGYDVEGIHRMPVEKSARK